MKPSPVEAIKQQSRGLRGTLRESLADDLTGAIGEADAQVIKFHGMYLQDDRDRRDERAAKKLERLYSFMIRLRLPGGDLSAEQWLALHHVAGEFSTGVIKITTRQTVQLHGVLKASVKPTIQAFHRAGLDSIATCGDINRNVAAASHPALSPLQPEVHTWAGKISRLLMPRTRAYYDIWLDEELLAEYSEEDPLYEDRYLPRKFKIGIGIPPNNDTDVLTNDLALIAIEENGKLAGFNIAVGGGLSQTFGNPDTYPRLATVIGFVQGEEQILKAVYEVLTVQRDFGNRSDRKLARLKYTLDRMGVEAFREELEKRCGFRLETARPFRFERREDLFGWRLAQDGRWYYTLFVEHGRITDDEQSAIKTALYEIAQTGLCGFRFTSNQNLILTGIADSDKPAIVTLLDRFGLEDRQQCLSGMRLHSMACVAFNTCPLALAEAQRYLPSLVSRIEPILERHGLYGEPISIRMTGCPNGCGRSVAAEIGLIGTAYGQYNLYIGGDRNGTRLNTLYRTQLEEPAILAELDHLLGSYAAQREPGESFGDFAHRVILPASTDSLAS